MKTFKAKINKNFPKRHVMFSRSREINANFDFYSE